MKRLLLILLASCGAVYAQQNALLLPWTPQQFTNTNGTVLANGKVCTYLAGTSTGVATYTDSTASVANNIPPNAILLDSTGRPTSGGIWLKPTQAYKITVLTAGSDNTCNTGVTIKTQDNVGLGASVTTNNTFTGTNTFLGTLNCKSVEGIACVDTNNTQGWAGSDMGMQINAALGSLVASQGQVWVFGSGTWSTNIFAGISRPAIVQMMDCGSITVTASQSTTNTRQGIRGSMQGCTNFFLGNATFDFFTPGATLSELSNIMFRPGVTRTGGWVVNPSGSGGFGLYHDLYMLDTFGGMKFAGAGGSAPSNGTIYNITFNESAATTSGTMLQIGGGDGTGISGFSFWNLVDAGDLSTHSSCKMIIDTGVDTVHFTDMNIPYTQGNPSTQPTLCIQKSVLGGSNIAPRWVTFDGHTGFEGGYNGSVTGADCVYISAGNNIVFQRLYAVSCARGVVIDNINSAPNSITINGGPIINNKAGGIVNITAVPNLGLHVNNVDFVNNSRATTNTTDDINIITGTSEISIIGSRFGTPALGAPAQKSRYGINLSGAGVDQFQIRGNTVLKTNMGTAFINNAAGPTIATIENGYDTGASIGASTFYADMTTGPQGLQLFNTHAGGGQWRITEENAVREIDLRSVINGNYAFRFLDSTPSLRTTGSVIADLGTICTNGELALSAGWQSTGSATVTGVLGFGQTCTWTITTGTTTAANPTVTDTLTNPLPTAAVCEMNIHGGSHTPAAGESFNQSALSATAPIFTFNGTPTAGGTTYVVTRRCGP